MYTTRDKIITLVSYIPSAIINTFFVALVILMIPIGMTVLYDGLHSNDKVNIEISSKRFVGINDDDLNKKSSLIVLPKLILITDKKTGYMYVYNTTTDNVTKLRNWHGKHLREKQ